MTQSFTEKLMQPAVDQIQSALQIAYQAGYDQAMIDMQNHEQHISQLVAEDIGE
jgi:hypothetical protein